jgi:hypothetical protein
VTPSPTYLPRIQIWGGSGDREEDGHKDEDEDDSGDAATAYEQITTSDNNDVQG